MVFINETGTIGLILEAGVNNVFGDIVTLVIFFIFLTVILCFMFKLPVELSAAVVLPLTLYSMAYYGAIIPLGGCLLFYMAFLFAYWIVGSN